VAERGTYYPYVLIVEQKGDWAQKIGYFVLNGYSMRIASERNSMDDPAVVELLP
jgi:hypothetical protein